MVPHAHRSQTAWLIGLLLIPFLAFGLRLWGLNAAGETWDEVAYYDAAHTYWSNVEASRWSDAEAWEANREHPALGKWLYVLPSIGAFRADVADLNPGRLLSASLGALTILVTMLIARRLYSPRVALLAGLTLALLPPFIALNRVLGLDTPTTFFFTLTIGLFLEALHAQSSGSRHQAVGWHVGAAISLGLTIGTRFSGVLLWPLLAAIAIVGTNRSSQVSPSRPLLRTTYYLLQRLWQQITKPSTIVWSLTYLLVPIAIVYGTWPWLWSDFGAHWEETIGHWTPVQSFFLGSIQFPPVGYYVQYFLVSVPALVVLASILFAARTIVRGSRSDWIVALWFAAVFAFALYGLRQGGIRYLLALTPALAIGVAAVVTELARRMKDRRAVWALPTIVIAYLAVHALVAQPYQLDYYNELTGGTGRVAAGKFYQVGWWGEGIDQAVDWLNDFAPYDATLSFTAIPDRAQRRLRSDFDHTAGLPDYVLTNPAFAWYLTEYPGLETRYLRVYTIDVQGASLAEVWERAE